MNPPDINQNKSLQLRRLIPAPRERVFRAWIEREALQQWLRPGGTQVVVSRLDAYVGGGFQFDTMTADGLQTVTTGKYLEINFPEKLVFTWTSRLDKDTDTLVTIEFIERGVSTELILTHDHIPNDTMFDIYKRGWGVLLDQLASFTLELT